MKQESLEERLKRLEAEQEQQDHDLDDLRDLEEILRLQKRLEEIANEKVETDTRDKPKVRHTSEAVKLEQKLEEAEKEQFEVNMPHANIPDIELPAEERNEAKPGFIVCLMFNKKSPSEWSDEGGGGWRERNRGQAYPNVKAAEQQLAKLKSQFPDYPLKIFRRV